MTNNHPPRPQFWGRQRPVASGSRKAARKQVCSFPAPQTWGGGAFLCIWAALLLAGCGGGGSNNPTFPGTDNGPGTIVGKVVDMDGNPVPGARVRASGQETATLGQGGYQLGNVNAGVQRVSALVTVNGATYTGSTQTLVLSDATASNANIAVSRDNAQAAISGTVRDANGRILPGARVSLGVFVTPESSTGAGDGSVASLVAFADNNGNYSLQNVPAPATQLTLAASLTGYANSRVGVSNIRVGETRGQDFTLSFGGSGSATPTRVVAYAFTQPAAAQRPFVAGQAAQIVDPSVYEGMRRTVSPAYAARIRNARRASSTRKRANASGANGNYTTEADVFFDNAQSDTVTGFRIYSAANGSSLQPYDFLQDPLANVYVDLDPAYTAGQTYSFAVSALGNGGGESGLSNTSSFVPLDLLRVNSPASGQTVSNPVGVSWQGVSGASDYFVFVYDQFPGPGVSGSSYDAHGSTFLTLPNLASGTYYFAVVGVTGDGSAETVSAIGKFGVR